MTASRQDSAPGQLVTSATEFAVRDGQPGRRQARVQRLEIANGNPAEDEVLLRRHAHGAVAVGSRQIRDHAQLSRGDVAERQADGDERVARLSLRRARSRAATRETSVGADGELSVTTG